MDKVKKGIDFLKCIVICAVLKAISLYKLSFIVGSQTAFFNGSSLAVPFVGFFAGSIGSILLFVIRLSNWYFYTTQSLHLLSFVIPGFFASLYWTTKGSIIRFWVPLVCMGAFIVHPVGRDSFIYSLYWLIPITIYASKRYTIWLEALGSTFVAHAIGSVIWIYTMPTTAEMWMLLIPVVAIERLLCMAGMVALCYWYTGINYMFAGAYVRIHALMQQCKKANSF